MTDRMDHGPLSKYVPDKEFVKEMDTRKKYVEADGGSAFTSFAIACDHAGADLCDHLCQVLKDRHIPFHIANAAKLHESCDYPDVIPFVVEHVLKGGVAGLLICGTGVGMSIGANRTVGIRAALCRDITQTVLARQHNDANILVLGQRVMGLATAVDCLLSFFETPFQGERHQHRILKLDALGLSPKSS